MTFPLHPQYLSIICSFLDDTNNDQLLKHYFHSITCKYPFYTIQTHSNRMETRRNGLLHSRNDEPAIVWTNGRLEWYRHGRKHRNNDNPAVIHSDGGKEWWMEGKHHRDNDKPTFVSKYGIEYWVNENGVVTGIKNKLTVLRIPVH